MSLRCGRVGRRVHILLANLHSARRVRTHEWNPTVDPEVTRRFSPPLPIQWTRVDMKPVVADNLKHFIHPITSLIAEYAESLHAEQDHLVTTARTVTDTFLEIQQAYYDAVTAPFVANVESARAAVAMTVVIMRAATVALNHALVLANATSVDVTDDSSTPKFRHTKGQYYTEYDMPLRTRRWAMQATNLYVLIQEYIHDAKEFASHAEIVGHDPSEVTQASNAAHYFALQAFFQTYKMHKNNVKSHQGTFGYNARATRYSGVR